MMAVSEVIRWLQHLRPTDEVGIDEGGLALATEDGNAYLEVGGFPEEEDPDAVGGGA